MQDMFLIIVREALQAHQDQIGRVDSDGTVRAVHDDLGGIFDPAQDADVSPPRPAPSRIMSEIWLRPIRQGTHLPQV